jgi:uncharacterized membrane protein
MIPKTHKNLPNLYALYALLVIITVYAAFFIAYSLQKHAAFQTTGFDLGNYDQAMWNTLRGKPLAMTTMQNISSRWALHFEPILLLLVPIYAVFSFPQTLLILQTVMVALGAVPIFLLARRNLVSDLAGLVFAIVYLLFPALQAALIFDFHAVAMASTFLSFALWFLATRRYRLLAIMALLAMSCKEDISLSVLMMGVYVWLAQRQRRWGAIIIGVSALWFALVNLVVIPAASPIGDNIHLTRYNRLGNSMGQLIGNVLLHPLASLGLMFSDGDRLRYWARAMMPVAFTAFLDPLTLLMAVPIMAINTLSSFPPNYQLDRFHYSATIVPFLTVASINGLARLIKFAEPKFKHVRAGFLQNALLAMVLLVTLAYQVQFGHTPIGPYFERPVITEHHHKAEAMLAQIPQQAAVAAQNNLIPHLSQRQWIFILPKLSHRGKQADYIALDMHSGLYPYSSIEAYCDQTSEFLASPDYGLIFADDGLFLFRRGAPDMAAFEPTSPCQ